MDEQIKKVAAFHRVFKQEYANEPTLISENEFLLRHKLMAEENDEYKEACWNGDIIDIADALGDQLYILCGTLLKHGLQYKIDQIFHEIHESNMSKLDENGEPILREDGKILKSSGYYPPSLHRFFYK
jgi:predicted HAD superfamily Cof-like phosphohydrolase